VTGPQSVFDRLKARGEEVLTQVSGELMSNPRFMKAMETAWQGKAKLDQAVARVLKTMNIPNRTEFKKALRRIEALEEEVAGLKAAQAKPKRRASKKTSTEPAAE
jgi:polyhydroxyalkanoate synthesis regulator phasin